MRHNPPKLEELISVQAALRWLLAKELRGDKRDLLSRARLSGLIEEDAGGLWKANGPMLERLARMALRHPPTKAAKLGEILHGIGEIKARCHADLLALFVSRLLRLSPRVPWKEVLDAASKCDGRGPRPPELETLAFMQWIAGAQLQWDTFKGASHLLDNSPRYSCWRFGLKFVAKIVLLIDPRAVDAWLKNHKTHSAVAVIGEAAMSLQLPWEEVSGANSLLQSKTPALRCIAAAALVSPIGLQPQPLNLGDCWRRLVEGGIEPGDAIWMVGLRLKNGIHGRYWAEHQLEGSTARLRYLEQNPRAAVVGAHNADAELRHVRTQVGHWGTRHAELIEQLEAMLGDVAVIWPDEGLSDEQMRNLEPIFVDTPEVRYRLAEKLAHGRNRDYLLETNIKQFKAFIRGKGELKTVLQSHFPIDEKTFTRFAPWVARSLVARYESGDNRGIGKRTGDLVQELGEVSEALAVQPFIAARQPTTWSSAAARAAYGHRFALLVAWVTPEDRRDKVEKLNELAIKHAFTLLCGPIAPHEQLFDRLASDAVYQMDFLPEPDTERSSWARSNDLPDYPRALAIWSSPACVQADMALASDLFHSICRLPLSVHDRDTQLSRMLTLLDIAIGNAHSTREACLIDHILDLWNTGYASWLPVTDRWASAADWFTGALKGDGPDREALKAEPVLANTFCLRLIEARH